ncbi:MAG: ankyrin repeat domain-containing protein, partial [bacterium]
MIRNKTILSSSLVVALAVLVAAATPITAPVADAAMKGDVTLVRKLLAKGERVNTPQGDGMTALHWAADRGDSTMADVLLRAHADVRAVTRIGAYTPLHVASRSGSAAVVVALLAAGSDVHALSEAGATALHFAAASGNAASVKALLDRGADANAREPQWGQTPLIFAAAYDRADVIRVLLQRGADANLHTKSTNLVEEGAREQAATRKRNEVLVSFEPERHRGDTARTLPPTGADSTARPARRAAPVAVPKGPFTAAQVQAAIDSGRAVLAAPAAPGKAGFTEAVDTINGGVAGYVSSVGGLGGLSALHHAVRDGNVAAVRALLDGSASINDRSGVDSTTPLLLALINGQFDVAKVLVEHGADANIASTAGLTPLYAVINTQWAPRSRFPQPQEIQNQKTSYIELMSALLKSGANPNARLKTQFWYFSFNNCGNANCGLENLDGTTPFWRAAYAVDVEAMRMLVKAGADPNFPSLKAVVAGGGRGGRGRVGAGGDSTAAPAGSGGGAAGGRAQAPP